MISKVFLAFTTFFFVLQNTTFGFLSKENSSSKNRFMKHKREQKSPKTVIDAIYNDKNLMFFS